MRSVLAFFSLLLVLEVLSADAAYNATCHLEGAGYSCHGKPVVQTVASVFPNAISSLDEALVGSSMGGREDPAMRPAKLPVFLPDHSVLQGAAGQWSTQNILSSSVAVAGMLSRADSRAHSDLGLF